MPNNHHFVTTKWRKKSKQSTMTKIKQKKQNEKNTEKT